MPDLVNPFLKEGNIDIKRRSDYMFDPEPKAHLVINKLYPILSLLSVHGIRLFVWLVCHLRRQQDFKKMDFDTVSKDYPHFCRTTYYKALQELIDNGIIAKRTKGTYWINALLLFHGNRVKYAFDNGIVNLKDKEDEDVSI
jgi:hypothetical protein